MKFTTRKYLIAFIALITAALFSGCQKDIEEGTVTLTAIADNAANGGKAYVYNNYICWHNTDIVKVNDVNCTTTVSISGGESAATARINEVTYNENGYVAAYPASSVKSMESGKNGKVTISVPVTQTYTTLTTASGTTAQVVPMPMVGRCANADEPLQFYNAAALVKVTLNNPAGKSLRLHQIILSTYTKQKIGGYKELTSSDEAIAPNDEADTMVTLDCSAMNPKPQISEVSDYYLVVAPFSGRMMVRVLAEDADNKKYIFTKTSENTQTIGRNQIGGITVSLTDNGVTKDFWGSGSSTDPYLITSADDLNAFKGKLGTSVNDTWNKNTVYYLQTADIDVSTSSWDSSDKDFFAHYDGGGHCIKLTLSKGGFVRYSCGGEFKNLKLMGTYTATNTSGAFCNYAWQDYGITHFENCTNCINVSGTSYIGGFVGYARTSVEFLNCKNYGMVSASGTTGYAGGFVGYLYEGNCTFDDCSNEKSASISCVKYGGGFLGGTYSSKDHSFILKNSCTNKGNITKTNSGEIGIGFGGIGGYLTATTVVVYEGAYVVNSGTISTTIRSYTGGDAAGIIGYCTVFTCEDGVAVNDGTINAGGSSVGGIVGYASSSATIVNCTNNKTVSGYYDVGGIIGYAPVVSINSCKNENTITAEFQTGGIVGHIGSGRVVSCSNTKKISASAAKRIKDNASSYDVAIGGIVGYSYSSTSLSKLEVFDCSNSGEIAFTGTNKWGKGVAGIVGYARDNENNIYNCYNSGTITSKNTCSGGILGQGSYYSSSYTTTFNIRNCYSNTTATYNGRTIAYINTGILNVEHCYVNSDNNASTDNATTTFDRYGSLTEPQTLNSVSCSTLHQALHNWQQEDGHTSYSDWEVANIPRLAWEVSAPTKRR